MLQVTMALAAVLFDLDGTLVDTERESADAMAAALREGQGIDVSEADKAFIIGRSWVQIYENVRAHHPALRWSRDELIAATAERRARILAEKGVRCLPGAREIVERFARVPRAIVTGSSRIETDQVLGTFGGRRAFGAVIASEDVATSKPSPDGYLAAAERLGVAATDCLVLEDSAAGIAAGRAAGAVVIAVAAGNFAGQDQSQAHRRVETLDEVTDALIAELMTK